MDSSVSLPVPRMSPLSGGPGGGPRGFGPKGLGGPKGPGGLFFFRRAPTEPVTIRVETFHDKYVIDYDFSKVDTETATQEFRTLCTDLASAGIQTEVRAGYDQSLLVFARIPKDLLGATVYKSRVKDWLYGVTTTQPAVGKKNQQATEGVFEGENLLSAYHLVNWPKDIGGAGITPESGQWERVRSIFPMHNDQANKALLKHLSKKMFLDNEDLDRIRDLFGAKVAFYFAYMQTYLLFLSFPAVTGFLAWMFLPKYSLAYAIVTLFGCTVFLEYWKIQQVDLSMRWNVKGVGKIKVNRPEFKYESIIVDSAGRTTHYFPRWKLVARQMLQVPFFLVALLVLGAIISGVFLTEVLISEAYSGPWQWYLEYLPTIILAVFLPYMTSFLEDIAQWMTEYENHRTNDQHEMSLTQKIFVLSFVANYLPILLTAFVYVPFGHTLAPKVVRLLEPVGIAQHLHHSAFMRDQNRLRNEVIALTVTGQISDMFEELIVPYVMQKARGWYRAYKSLHATETFASDDPAEEVFLQEVRRQATLPPYNVQDDISEMVIQFGHLALFSPVWPLVSIGFFINNWIELRSDFFKICFEHQRPHPVRTDGIGPWIDSLDALTWLGSISTAAIVHMFSEAVVLPGRNWWSLPITIFVSEHVFLLLRFSVRFVLQRIGSDEIRKERMSQYSYRKKYLDNLEAASRAADALDVGLFERRKSVRLLDPDLFWTRQVGEGVTDEVGVDLIEKIRNEQSEVGGKGDEKYGGGHVKSQ